MRAREIQRFALLVAADYLGNSGNIFQVPRQKGQALFGMHRMAMKAYRRAEPADGIRILPEESYAVVFQVSSSSYPLVSFRSGYNPFAVL